MSSSSTSVPETRAITFAQLTPRQVLNPALAAQLPKRKLIDLTGGGPSSAAKKPKVEKTVVPEKKKKGKQVIPEKELQSPRRDLSSSETSTLKKLRKFKVGTDRESFLATEYDESEEYILPSNMPEDDFRGHSSERDSDHTEESEDVMENLPRPNKSAPQQYILSDSADESDYHLSDQATSPFSSPLSDSTPSSPTSISTTSATQPAPSTPSTPAPSTPTSDPLLSPASAAPPTPATPALSTPTTSDTLLSPASVATLTPAIPAPTIPPSDALLNPSSSGEIVFSETKQ